MLTIHVPQEQNSYKLFSKDTLELKPGITNLVGCNGYGKSTLLYTIKRWAEQNNIPVFHWNDRMNGQEKLIDHTLRQGGRKNTETAASLMLSSEGEGIEIAFSYMADLIFEVLNKALSTKQNDVILLFDAIDSGASINTIRSFKNIFNILLSRTKEKNVNLYIVSTSNTYEMTIGTNNMDTCKLQYIPEFFSYEKFSDFILKTFEIKQNRKKIHYRRTNSFKKENEELLRSTNWPIKRTKL